MELLNLRKLMVLVSVAETGSATETGKQLNLGQSAISQTLKELQQDFGAPLFERHGRGLQATEAGLRLAQEGQRVLAALNRTNTVARALQRGEQDEVRLGVMTAFIHGEIARCMARFSAKHEQLSLALESHSKEVLLDKLLHGELDLAAAIGGAEDDGIHTVATITMRVICIVPLQHPLAKRQVVRERDLAAHREIILTAGSPLRIALEAAGILPHRDHKLGIIKASTQRAIVTMVEAGAGVALVDPLVLMPGDQVKVLRFEPAIHVTLSIFAREDWQDRPLVRELALALYASLAPLSSDAAVNL